MSAGRCSQRLRGHLWLLRKNKHWVPSRVLGSVSWPALWPGTTGRMKEEPRHLRQERCSRFTRQEDAVGLHLPEYTIPVLKLVSKNCWAESCIPSLSNLQQHWRGDADLSAITVFGKFVSLLFPRASYWWRLLPAFLCRKTVKITKRAGAGCGSSTEEPAYSSKDLDTIHISFRNPQAWWSTPAVQC